MAEAEPEPGGQPEPEAVVGPYPAPGGLCRVIRRRADASQREMAERTGLSRSTIARIESGRLIPSLAVLGRLLDAGGLTLVAVDHEGRLVVPMLDLPGDQRLRDGSERRFPAHLDTILDPKGDEWWGSCYGLAKPPETGHRDRVWRDVQRRRSQWDVRVQQFRNVPPPPTVQQWLRRRR